MEFIEFEIKNFKGIEYAKIQLNKSPNSNVHVFVGLNESGKTSILEAINFFNSKETGMDTLNIPGYDHKDIHEVIPISKRGDFNEEIYIRAVVLLNDEDRSKILNFVQNHYGEEFVDIEYKKTLTFTESYSFLNSSYDDEKQLWTSIKVRNKNLRNFVSLRDLDKSYKPLYDYIRSLLPRIVYFPNFLFDFPSKIRIDSSDPKDKLNYFYRTLVQDIIISMGKSSTIDDLIINRVKDNKASEKKALKSFVADFSRFITSQILGKWNEIFRNSLIGAKIQIEVSGEKTKSNPFLCFLEFSIEAENGSYSINERSLGFRWFFSFLMLTQFRAKRSANDAQTLFLFDEPASNLHPFAQTQLLKSFDSLTKDNAVIYTTHSHHMISTSRLENTYIVKNEATNLDVAFADQPTPTNIKIEPYRSFVNSHPHNTAYFKPVLDALDYVPSDFEDVKDALLLEGKNDFYALKYISSIILKRKFSFNLVPSTGSGNLDILISLYTGWGKNYNIFLDSDKAGIAEKKRYTEKFGLIVENSIFTLEDVSSLWKGFAMEKVFHPSDLLAVQNITYPGESKYSKDHFNRAIQEALVRSNEIKLNDQTLKNFKKIFDFLDAKFPAVSGIIT